MEEEEEEEETVIVSQKDILQTRLMTCCSHTCLSLFRAGWQHLRKQKCLQKSRIQLTLWTHPFHLVLVYLVGF